MVIELPFAVNERVFSTSADHIFNSGLVEAVEVEIFVKVKDDGTGDIRILKPEVIKTRAETESYIDEIRSKLAAMPAEGPLSDTPPTGA